MYEMNMSNLDLMVKPEERVLWRAKPYKLCFILEAIFNSFLPFAFIWFLFDAFFLFMLFGADKIFEGAQTIQSNELLPVMFFFALHMMPVWIYLAGVIGAFSKYKHTEYIVTDKAFYVSQGTWSQTFNRILHSDILTTSIHQSSIDKMLGAGDVIINIWQESPDGDVKEEKIEISDIYDYKETYALLERLSEEAKRAKEQS